MKEDNSKKRIKTILISSLVIYIFLLFYLLHVLHVSQITRKDFIVSLSIGAENMFSAPLSIFPFNGPVLTWIMIYTLIFILLMVFLYVSMNLRKHDDLETIAGDAHWMNKKEMSQYNLKRVEPVGKPEMSLYDNAIVSNKIFLGMDTRKTKCTLNVLIIGGTGTGKSFRVIGPNIMQHNCSMIITDPSGNLYKEYGSFLEYYGYKVKCFNLSDMRKSNHYNPFNYIHSDKDVEILVNTLITNTTAPGKGGDEFWTKSETALFCARSSYLYHYRPKEEQTFSQVLALINAGNIDENNSATQSTLDLIFEDLRKKHPDCFAITQYDTFRLATGKTLKSILISAGVRLQSFALEDVRIITESDDIALDYIADEKTAIFVIIPTDNKTFNYLAGLMYSQLFTGLYSYAETTATYGYLVMNSDNEVVKTYRATGIHDEEEARVQAENFIELAKSAKVVKNENFVSVRGDKKKDFWEIRADNGNGQLLAFRGDKSLAEEALQKIQNGYVMQNSKQSNNGQRCPIHVRFLLDEFSNTGKIPDFTEKISTIRKYEISTTIILQSLKQLENSYEKEWDVITANCDTTAYLGGGADEKTIEWFVKLLGKKTVRGKNETFNGKSGGSESYQRQGLDLISVSQLRTLPENKCVVVPRSFAPWFGDMYDTPHHPEWKLLQSLPAYEYSANKYSYLLKATQEKKQNIIEENIEETENEIVTESKTDALYRISQNEQEIIKSESVNANLDASGNKKIGDITTIDPMDEDISIIDIISNIASDDVSSESISDDEMAEMIEFYYGEDMAFSVKPMA